MKEALMEFKTVSLEIPKDCNIIVGHTHFIKTVEDLYELMVSTSPNVKFGVAFCEASGPCLIRSEGNDKELTDISIRNAESLGCGHAFVILLKDGYPINFLNAIKNCQEVCTIHCATANPIQGIVAESEQGRGLIGVIDGFSPKGIESESQRKERKELLRKFGYKLS
jgi:uncharacterized protein